MVVPVLSVRCSSGRRWPGARSAHPGEACADRTAWTRLIAIVRTRPWEPGGAADRPSQSFWRPPALRDDLPSHSSSKQVRPDRRAERGIIGTKREVVAPTFGPLRPGCSNPSPDQTAGSGAPLSTASLRPPLPFAADHFSFYAETFRPLARRNRDKPRLSCDCGSARRRTWPR
jgi:hypothetical protein